MGSACVDLDECSDGQKRCTTGENIECRNTLGSFKCVCKTGFYKNASGICVGKQCERRCKETDEKVG